nr:MAG TPA: hypothetical protein [Bacteriophage sp.]DAT01097.1 MAG TPA: hypothetical protein [Caudoviricetes sp.]
MIVFGMRETCLVVCIRLHSWRNCPAHSLTCDVAGFT